MEGINLDLITYQNSAMLMTIPDTGIDFWTGEVKDADGKVTDAGKAVDLTTAVTSMKSVGLDKTLMAQSGLDVLLYNETRLAESLGSPADYVKRRKVMIDSIKEGALKTYANQMIELDSNTTTRDMPLLKKRALAAEMVNHYIQQKLRIVEQTYPSTFVKDAVGRQKAIQAASSGLGMSLAPI